MMLAACAVRAGGRGTHGGRPATGRSSGSATALMGLGVAPQFATMIAFAERHVAITGAATAWFIGAAAVGAFGLPWMIGQLFERTGSSTMPIGRARWGAARHAGLVLRRQPPPDRHPPRPHGHRIDIDSVEVARRSTGLDIARVAALLSQEVVELGGQVAFSVYGRLQSLVVDGLELADVAGASSSLDGLVVAPVPSATSSAARRGPSARPARAPGAATARRSTGGWVTGQVVRHGRPQRDRGQPARSRLLVEHTHDTGRALVAGRLSPSRAASASLVELPKTSGRAGVRLGVGHRPSVTTISQPSRCTTSTTSSAKVAQRRLGSSPASRRRSCAPRRRPRPRNSFRATTPPVAGVVERHRRPAGGKVEEAVRIDAAIEPAVVPAQVPHGAVAPPAMSNHPVNAHEDRTAQAGAVVVPSELVVHERRSTTWSMQRVRAATSSGSTAGNMPMRSWLRPSLR